MSRQTNNTRIPWKKWQNRQGFTLAELLIVIAIIGVLSGLAFIAVWTHQRSMGQLERDGIAKQIFIAAQNHLSAARGEGYLGRTGFGTEGKASEDIKGNYYFVVTDGSASDDAEDIFNLMLPFGALDETIRAGGSYLIRYNKDSGTVLDVFYCSTHGSPTRFNNPLEPKDYTDLLTVAGDSPSKKSERRTYTKGNDCIVGWYGGAEGIEHKEPLSTPRLTKHNEEILWVDVSDDNKDKEGASLRLEVTGETSGAIVVFILRKDGTNHSDPSDGRIRWDGNLCHVILDDITTNGRRFTDINEHITNDQYHSISGRFLPGENLNLKAVAFNNTGFAFDVPSKTETANSLFADGTNTTAFISNFRHFENLDKDLSDFAYTNAAKSNLPIQNAEQTKDLIWFDESSSFTGSSKPEDFLNAVKYIEVNQIKEKTSQQASDPLKVHVGNGTENENCLHPVSLSYHLSYDGKSHQNSNVRVNTPIKTGTNTTGAAGLFGTIGANNSEIKNLKLYDFSITGNSEAGTLAGTVNDCKITNVLAYHAIQTDSYTTVNVSAGTSAGGLIGSASGTTVTNSAAALVVNGGAEAGGLIGKSSGGSVSGSFSGGHTKNAVYYSDEAKSNPIYNVTGGTIAGGLIGDAGNTSISNSYSTCSASGTTVGGFVGTGSGSISNSYCTGLVSGNTKGAFAGSLSGSVSNCQYYEIINEVRDDNQGYIPLSSVGGGGSSGGITAFDQTAASYNSFCGVSENWRNAHPYDSALNFNYYEGKYNLRTVERLGAAVVKGKDFVYDHYGDWPAPEAFVVNEGSSSGNSLSNP